MIESSGGGLALYCSHTIHYPKMGCDELEGLLAMAPTAPHITTCTAVAALSMYAFICMAFVLLHMALFNQDEGSASSNTLFDFVSSVGG